MEVRCAGGLHAKLTEDGLLEFKCKDIRCTGDERAFVFHYFDPATGILKSTSRNFRNPLKGMNNGNR